jgi:hypothetical protein
MALCSKKTRDEPGGAIQFATLQKLWLGNPAGMEVLARAARKRWREQMRRS